VDYGVHPSAIMIKRQIVVILPCLVAAASLCHGQQRKLSRDLEGRDPEALVNVIVQYKNAPRQQDVDAVVHRGGRHLRMLNVVHGAVYSIAAKDLADLANDPAVKYISPDRAIAASSNSSNGLPANQLQPDYKLQAIGADVAQLNGFNGAGIGVAIIDSGISNRPDLRQSNSGFTSAAASSSFGGYGGSRVVHSENILTGGGSADDTYGHGTHVAGIVGGNGSQSTVSTQESPLT
jgi:serine protease AprX